MTRPFRTSHFVLSVFLLAWFTFPAFGQTATEYSEKDKKKLAEIAQRPEVINRIQDTWDELRRRDMDVAFKVNQTSRAFELSPTALAEFRQNFGELYNNPILQGYVNTIGQKIVPNGSPNLYTFRLLLDPVPRAEALSTGTIYVSTGLVALLDDEAQLAYVLGHEIAHVERRHAYNEIRNKILEEEFDKEKQSELTKKRTILGAVTTIGGAAIGGAAGGGYGALAGGLIGFGGGYVAGQLIFRDKFKPTEWSTVYENEADEAGLKYMLDQNYDAREIPRMYARLDNLVARDTRVGLGFIGNPVRTRERQAQINKLITTAYKVDLENRMKTGLVGSGPEFQLLMSALKRDNGVIALEYDLYAVARDNLEEAVKLRSSDPRAHYYLGKVIAATGRSSDDKQQALTQFLQAIQYDAERGAYAEPYLEQALYQISQNEPAMQDQIQKELKTYVALYQRQHQGQLPPNMYILYDYMLVSGDKSWYVPPTAVVSTKDVGALFVTQVASAPSTSTVDVVNRAIGAPTSDDKLKTTTVPEKPAKPSVKKTATPAPH